MIWAQGDIIIERVDTAPSANTKVGAAAGAQSGTDPDNSIVLARGEVTGHRHRFTGDSGAALFRDDGLARDIPPGLYIGHVEVPQRGADLVHEEHDAISLPAGTYRIRRQREWDAAEARIVAD